jgi:hypothetical protein
MEKVAAHITGTVVRVETKPGEGDVLGVVG